MILITGSRGFIGQHLAEILGEVRHVNRRDGIELSNIPDDYFVDVDTVHHLAGYIGNDEKAHITTNIVGTTNLLEMVRRHDVSNFVFSSSAAVYGQPVFLPIDEGHPTNPVTLYGKYKLETERIVMDFGERYGFNWTILRIFNVYGKNDVRSVISKFLSDAVTKRMIVVNGYGNQTRDFIDVKDVASAFILLTGERGIFNIGSGRELSLNYIITIIKNKYPDLSIIYKTQSNDEIQRSVAEISKAKKIGFVPKRTIEDFIANY
jgi:UDP-glucose 4-epimerase